MNVIYDCSPEGRECRRVLQHLSKLEDNVPVELKPFVSLLRAFKAVDDKVLGFTLASDWEQSIKKFGDLYKDVMKLFPGTVTETVKAHTLIHHVKQFIKADGCTRGMAEFSEQGLETAHQYFDKIWQRLKVMDMFSEAFKVNYLRAIAIFNRLHS